MSEYSRNLMSRCGLQKDAFEAACTANGKTPYMNEVIRRGILQSLKETYLDGMNRKLKSAFRTIDELDVNGRSRFADEAFKAGLLIDINNRSWKNFSEQFEGILDDMRQRACLA